MTFSVDGPRYAKESTSAGLMEIIKFASVCRPYGRGKFMYGKFVDKKFQGLTSWVCWQDDMKKALFSLIKRVQILSLFWTLKIHGKFNNFSLFSRPKMWKLGTLSSRSQKNFSFCRQLSTFPIDFHPKNFQLSENGLTQVDGLKMCVEFSVVNSTHKFFPPPKNVVHLLSNSPISTIYNPNTVAQCCCCPTSGLNFIMKILKGTRAWEREGYLCLLIFLSTQLNPCHHPTTTQRSLPFPTHNFPPTLLLCLYHSPLWEVGEENGKAIFPPDRALSASHTAEVQQVSSSTSLV